MWRDQACQESPGLEPNSTTRQSALSAGGRKTIGLLVGQGTGSYDHGLYEGVREAAAARDINVVNLMCGSLDSNLWNPFEGQNNMLFNLPSKVVFDGLLLIPSILYNYSTPDRVEQVLAGYRDIPMVSIGEPVPGRPGLFVDNTAGIRELVRHIYERHGRRRFAFISGPATNSDAIDRLRGFREGIEACGLAFDPSMVADGNFWWTSGRAGALHFFGPGRLNPDALICANDYTAFGAHEQLRSMGLRVPEDVVLTGYDNDQDSQFSNPPLTTIEQPLDAIADRAVEILGRMIDGQAVEARTLLPTRTVFRRSCGCHSGLDIRDSVQGWEGEIGDDDLCERIRSWVTAAERPPRDSEGRSTLLDTLYDILFVSNERGKVAQVRSIVPALLNTSLDAEELAERSFRDGVQAVSLETKEVELGLQATKTSSFKDREVQAIQNIVSVYTLDEMFDRLLEELPALGVTSLFLNLFPRPFEHGSKAAWSIPAKARCVFAYVDGQRLALPPAAAVFKTDHLVPDVPELAGKRRNLISMSSFFRNEVYGFLVFESVQDDMLVLGNLATHISSAYRSILGYQKLEKSAERLKLTLRQLQASNRELNALSTRDAMTGLYNRRGFELIGQKVHDLAERNGSEYVLFFADTDGLKTINDTWGHGAGDEAIMACGNVLRQTFRKADLVARLGGDEFVVLATLAERKSPARMLARLDAALRRLNQEAARPYQIDLSIGYVLLSECRNLSFAEIMARADVSLYRQKMTKKAAS